MTDVVVEYLGALQAERGASRNTLAAYRRDLTDFTQFLNDQRRALRRTSPDDLVGYLERLRARGLRSSSVARRVSALRGLFRHLVSEGELRRDPTEHLEVPRRPRALPRTLSREDAAALVEAPDLASPRGVRDRTVLELLYATGMRASECLGLAGEDVNLTAGYVICTGKGRQQRLVPLGAAAAQWITRYLREARPLYTRKRDSGRLFVNPRGGPLSRQSLWAIVRRAAATAGAARVLRDDLVRADALGLGTLRATTLARPLPSVDDRAGETAVRRLLAGGAPLVVVHGAKGPSGAVSGRLAGVALPDASAAAHVGRGLAADVGELLVTIGRIAEEHDSRAFLVGGLVRDLWRGAPIAGRDLDVVVEGDGPTVARRLASTLGGTLLEHRRFLTASVDTSAFGRIDVATSRSEP